MDRTVVILAAGANTRWLIKTHQYQNLPKQLCPIGGECPLSRMIRQLALLGIVPYTMTSNAKIASASPLPIKPASAKVTCDTLLSSQHLWKGQVIILLGDVIYSDQALDTIISSCKAIEFFGRSFEIFGLSFNDYSLVSHSALIVVQESEGKLHNLYRQCSGKCITSFLEHREKYHFTTIDDFTTDIDTYEDYLLIKEKLESSGVLK